jgi:hypothetical protein
MLRTGQPHTPEECLSPDFNAALSNDAGSRLPGTLPGPDSHRLAALNLTPGYIPYTPVEVGHNARCPSYWTHLGTYDE